MGEFNILTECYRSALKMAGNYEMKTVAFPCIGTGLSGFPPRVAARIALQEVREYLDAHTNHRFERIIFCVNSAADEKAYMDFFPVFFPPTHGDLDKARTSDWSANRAALAAQILETRAQVQKVRDEIMTGFGQMIPASVNPVTNSLRWIDDQLASIRSFLLGSQELKRSLGDLNLLCSVLLTVCGSLREMTELAKDTVNSGRTHEDIWNDNAAHMLDRHEVSLQEFMNDCYTFATSLDQVLTQGASEAYMVATIRQKLENYGVKQKGQDSEGIRDHLDEVLYIREFQRDASSYNRDVARLPQIFSVAQLYSLGELETKQTLATPSAVFNQAVCLARDDITRIEADVMVNSTDSAFSGMGTLDRTVLKKGGSGLQEEVKKFRQCKEGDVKLTPGYLLPAKHILHVIPPEQYRKNTKDVLRNIYREVLYTAMQMKATSITIPSIGTGMLNYPRRDCASLAMEEVKRFLESAEPTNVLAKIIFVVYSSNDEFIYKSLLPIYFPPSQQTAQAQSGTQATGQPSRPIPTPRRSLFGSVSEALHGIRFGKQPEASRPINSYEEHALIEFEKHAKQCITCRYIERLYVKGRDLCETGYRLAQTLIWYMGMSEDGLVYSRPDKTGKRDRLEVPADTFPFSLLLLRTIEKSNRDKDRESPFVSQRVSTQGQAQRDNEIPADLAVPDLEDVIEQATEPPAKMQAYVCMWKDLPQGWMPISKDYYSVVYVYKHRIDIHEAKSAVQEEGSNIYNNLLPGDDPVLSLDLTPAVTSLMRKSSNEVVISGMRKTFTSFSREGPMLFRCNDRIESDALFDAFQRAINRSRQHPVEKASADAQRLLDYENEVEGLHPQGVAYQILRYLEHDLKSRPGSYIGQRTEEIAYALHEDPVAISASLQELVTQQYVHNTIDGSTWVISRSPTELPVLSTPSVEQAKPDIYLLATRVLSFMEHMNRTPTERKGQTVQDLASALQLPTSDVWAAVRHLTARKEIYRPSDEETWVVTPKAGRLSFLTQETESNDARDTELAGPNEEATNTSSISERALSWLQRLERTSGRKEHISDLAHGLNTSVAELESVLPKLEAEGMVENTGEDSYWATTLAPMNDSGHPDQSAQQTASWVPSIELTQVNRPSPTPFLSLNDYATAYTDDQGANKVRINKALIDPLIIQEKGLTYQDETHHMVVHQASSEQELFEMAEKTSLLRSGADGRTPDYAPPSRDREDPYWEPPPFNPGLEWTPQLDVYSDDIWHYVSFPASPEPGKKWTRIDKRIVDSQVMDGFTFEILENNLLVQAELSMEQIHDLVEMTRAIRTGKGKEKIKDETVDQPPSYLPLLEHPWTPASVPGFDLSQVTAESIDLQPFVGFGTDGPSLSHGWRRWTQLDKRLVLPDILDEAGLEFIVRGEYFVVPGHLSEKEMRTLIKMSGTCGGNPVKSQTSDNAPRLESKSVVIRDAATFTDMPPSPTAQYGRHGDINPGNILRFDNKQNPEQSGIDAGLLQNMIQQIDASDSSAIPGTRWTRIDQRLVDARVLEAAGEDFESTGDRLILHRVLRRGEIEKWAEETRKIRGEQEVRGDATDDPKTHTIALMESMHRHFGDQVVFIQASSIGEGNTGIWTCIDGRLVDPRILKAATEDFTQNDENTLVLRRVAGLGEIKKWAEKTKEIIEEENQEYGKKRNFWAGQTKLDDVRDESKQAEAGKLQEMGKSGGNTRASREHRSRSESWRDGRGEKDRQQAKLDRILAGDTKEDEQRHYKDFDSYSDADSDADFENAPPSPIQQPTHLIPDAEAWNEDPAPVLDLDIVDIKDYYDNNYTKSRSHARWTRIDKRLLDEQVLIDAEEEFDDRGDRFFYVHRVLRRVEVQLLAEKTRDRRKALREILEKGPLSNTFRSDSKPYIRGGKRLVGLSYQPLDEEQMDVPLPTTATSTDPLPASISELPASNHHCVVYEAGSSSGPLWRWTCCNCGGGNFVAVDAECSHCHNHWRE
jgi:O-acetyl-ADP-ribose deacetylase (regulator of RNase III)